MRSASIDTSKNEPKWLAKRFLNSAKDRVEFPLLDRLCQLSFENSSLSEKATKAIFYIVESLCDDFSDFGVSLTSQVLTHILQYIRKTPEGSELDTLLNELGFSSPEALLDRYQRLRQKQHPLPESDKERVKKILILSRVTAGADLAITAVIVKRLSAAFPSAKLVLIGPSHLFDMFGSIPNTCCFTFIYKNDGTLFEKMTSWPMLLTIAKKESHGYKSGEVLLFDPDSRLSQLGLLPLVEDQYTYIFPSRVTQPENSNDKNLSYLVNKWLNDILNQNLVVYPKLSFTAPKASIYTKFHSAIKECGCKFAITINFGVGNNPAKKLPGRFEEALLQGLLQNPNTVVILDTGRGKNEFSRVQHLLSMLKNQDIATAEITSQTIEQFTPSFSHGLIAFKGSLGALGKMIDATDCFIGYDSCGQHIANATRTPAVILFAGAPNKRFINRWTPTNKENVTIPVDTKSLDSEADRQSLFKRVHEAVNKIRSNSSVSD